MAKKYTPESISSFAEGQRMFDAMTRELELAGKSVDDFTHKWTAAGGEIEEAKKVLIELKGYVEGLKSSFDGAGESLYTIHERLQAVTGELKTKHGLENQARTLGHKLLEISTKLSLEESRTGSLSKTKLKNLQEQLELEKERWKLLEKELRTRAGLSPDGEITEEDIKRTGLSDQEKAALMIARDRNTYFEQLNTLVDELAEKQKKYNKALGLTGGLVKGASALLKKMGIESDIMSDALEKSQEAMRQTIQDAADAKQEVGRFQVMLAGLGPVVLGFGEALTDPLAISGAILEKFYEIDKKAVEVGRVIGKNIAVSVAWNNKELALTTDVMEEFLSLVKETGMNMRGIFSVEELSRLGEAKTMLGLSAEQTNRLAIYGRVAKTNTDGYLDNIVGATNAYNAQTKSVVAGGLVLQDVLSTSSGIAMSLGGNPKKLAQAAAAARNLGMELAKVDSIASSLLDFESSIQNELEAQLLTNRNISLAKAREFALTNDLTGLTEELRRQGASSADFAKMNRIQQESLAKALGMTREELGKLAEQELLRTGATKDALSAARGMTREDYERVSAQESLATAFGKLAEPLASILTLVTPLIEGLAKVIAATSNWLFPLLLAVGMVGKLTGGFAGLMGVLKGFAATSTTVGAATTKMSAGVGRGLTAIGAGLRSFVSGLASIGPAATAALPAVGVILGVAAAISGVVLSIGAAIRWMTPAIKAMGDVFKAVFSGIGNVVTASLTGIKDLLNSVTIETVGVMFSLAGALMAVSGSLLALSVAGVLAAPVLLALRKIKIEGPSVESSRISTTKPGIGSEEDRKKEGGVSLDQIYDRLGEILKVSKEKDAVYLDGHLVGMWGNVSKVSL